MASVGMKGPYTYGTSNPKYNVWHSKQPNRSGAVLSATGTFNATREAGTIKISASITITGENSGVSFGFPLWFYVKANGVTIHTWTSEGNLNIRGQGSTWSKNFAEFEYYTNSAVDLSFQVHCAAGTGSGTSESGSCDQGYSYVDLVSTSTGSSTLISIPAYNPWTDPTNLSNVRVNPLSIKPEGNITISWNAATSGTGNTIDKYEIAVSSNRFGWKYKEVGNVTSTTVAPRSLLDYDNQIRPGDIISVAVRVHYTSQTSGHSDGWLSWVYASSSYNVSVYKDGNIYYKNNSGNVVEVTRGYYKDSSGAVKKMRYSKVKTSGGAIKIIDVYTTHYE